MVEKNKMFQLFANLYMCILCVLCILPFMLLFASSLTNERTLIQDGYRFFTTKIDFAAYKYIFVDTDSILRGYGVSVLVTVVGTVTNCVSALHEGAAWKKISLFFLILYDAF